MALKTFVAMINLSKAMGIYVECPELCWQTTIDWLWMSSKNGLSGKRLKSGADGFEKGFDRKVHAEKKTPTMPVAPFQLLAAEHNALHCHVQKKTCNVCREIAMKHWRKTENKFNVSSEGLDGVSLIFIIFWILQETLGISGLHPLGWNP